MLRCCGAALRRSAFKMCECKLVTHVGWVSQTLLECRAFSMSHSNIITLINANYAKSNTPKKVETKKFQAQFIFVPFFLRHNIWALCPKGFYMNGIRTGSHLPFLSFLNHIDEARCCHPTDHPSSYEDCYEEDVAISFNNEGWSECQKNGYYMSGLYKSNCDELNCIDKFRCCKHLPKNGNYIVVQLFLYTKRDKNRLSRRIFNFPKLRCVRGS